MRIGIEVNNCYRLLLIVILSIYAVSCGGGKSADSDMNSDDGDIDSSGDANVWETDRVWTTIPHSGKGECQTHILTEDDKDGFTTNNSNATIESYPNSELVSFTITNREEGKSYSLAQLGTDNGWVPAGTYIGFLNYTCVYRASHLLFDDIVSHFSDAFDPKIDIADSSSETQRLTSIVWEGGEVTDNLYAVFEARPNEEFSTSMATFQWDLLYKSRYTVSILRCEDNRYPPAFDPETGDPLGNNAVCITIHDGGVWAISDYLSENLSEFVNYLFAFTTESLPLLTKD